MGSIYYNGTNWPMALLSYYPVYCWDPACPYGDKLAQQGDCVHEGIHALLADMPGCKNACWFQEGGNTWLQSIMEGKRSGGAPTAMGYLSAGAALAPFMPIECYSGWLQDDSFGGLTLGYYALEKSLKGKKAPEPIDGFTWQQRFFLGWAQVWHENITNESLINQVQTNEHSPGRWRINATLAQMKEFSDAFGKGKMAVSDAERVVIW
jgi:hypothetical protein